MNKKILLWDLHEVVFTRNLCHWFYLLCTYNHKWEVIRALDWHIIRLCIRYALHILHIKRAELTSQELIDYARSKNKERLVELTIAVACDYTPIQEVAHIICALHAKGYTQYVGSNIGIDVFNHFKYLYPSIFACFNGYHMVHYKNGMLIKKPNPQFFRTFLETYNFDSSSVLFIDDKAYNVDAARQAGMSAIQFHDIEQLKQELRQQGIG